MVVIWLLIGCSGDVQSVCYKCAKRIWTFYFWLLFYIFQFSLKTCFNKNSDYGNKFSLNSDIWICRSAESIYILFLQFYWLNSSFTSLRTEFIVHLMCDCLKRKTFVILLFKTVPLCCCWCVLFYLFLVWKKD